MELCVSDSGKLVQVIAVHKNISNKFVGVIHGSPFKLQIDLYHGRGGLAPTIGLFLCIAINYKLN